MNYQLHSSPFTIPTPIIRRTDISNLPYIHLNAELPQQEYKPVKTLLIPFDPRTSNNGRFDSLLDAMGFIYTHCHQHHGAFTKQLAKKYLDFCRILNGPTGKYIIMPHVGKKEFDQAFNTVRHNTEDRNIR